MKRQTKANERARPVGAANEPPPSAVKQCGATERRLRNGDRRGLPFAFRPPAVPVVATRSVELRS